MGLYFFRRVNEMQKKYAAATTNANAIQTNSTLHDDDSTTYFRDESFLIGLSIDGPCELHDYYRLDKSGRPSFDAVSRGMNLLKRHGSGYIQFIPLVERAGGGETFGHSPQREVFAAPPSPEGRDRPSPVTPWSVEPLAYGKFLAAIFDQWVRNDVGSVFVQIFDVMLGVWMGMEAALCVFRPRCGRAMALEHNGDLYACDHYVYPQYKLGNILDTHVSTLLSSPVQTKFGNDKFDTLPRYCRQCDVRFACNGECPKHRFMMTPDGEAGLNYLCAGYKHFFAHIAPHMRTMGELLARHRPPADIMRMLRAPDLEPSPRTPQRNDPCPCGSGKKYKKCCGR
jgi:uncharacterized protein